MFYNKYGNCGIYLYMKPYLLIKKMVRKLLNKVKDYLSNLSKRLLDEKKHRKIIKTYTYVCLGAVSLFMTIVNIFTSERILGFATGIFALVCLVNLFLVVLNENLLDATSISFAIGVVTLFTFFIVFGYPDGFSITWIALMPPIALLFYGTKKGSLVTAIMFVILLFFMWTPWGHNLLQPEAKDNYSSTFMLRYPFLCAGSYLLALILGLINDITFKALTVVNRKNQELSKHDPLTGLFNRIGILDAKEELLLNEEFVHAYYEIIDIDHFKQINDTYGHIFGDFILKEISRMIETELPGIKCRFGGDEFLVICLDKNFDLEVFKNFVEKVSSHMFEGEGNSIHVTISCGVHQVTKESMNFEDDCIRKADKALYESKGLGGNKLSVFEKM